MLSSTLRHRLTGMATIAAAGVAASTLVLSPASADPRQHTNQLVGTGSDTTQEILNAFAGQADDDYYPPLATDGPTGRFQITSWDAVAPGDPQDTFTCISPRAGLNSFQRPNGSSQGRMALSLSSSGQPLTFASPTGDAACAGKSTAGIVNFARSSSGPSGNTNLGLAYIPFGRDALTYAFSYVDGVAGDAGDATSNGDATLSFAELQSVFQGGGQGTPINGLLVVPCDIQHGSGTQKDWPGKVGAGTTVGLIDAAAQRCDALGVVGADPNGRLQESKPNQLEMKADAFEAANPGVPAMLVVGHSVSNFVAQSNDASPSFLVPDVALGSAVPGELPFSGSAPTLVPNPDFYSAPNSANAPTPGRKVYNVLLSELVDDIGNEQLKQMFVGPNSQVCQATATIQKFGFALLDPAASAPADRCGDASARGDFIINA